MRRVEVALGAHSYPVLIDSGLIEEAGEHLKPFAQNGRIAIVSEENVWPLMKDRMLAVLARQGIRPVSLVLPPGESSKSWQSLKALIDEFSDLGLNRDDSIVALGGGVIGDLAGFAAAIYKRGCGYIQIPTTLLAQVDSSVGGKTAINIAAGKNLVGAFHQPSLVLIDPSTLATLPERETRAGYAEVVKYGLLGAESFFRWCEETGPALLSGDSEAQLYAIETCVRAKAEIVSADERETGGTRALLNLGHTFAHALEAETGFSDRLLHGEAVAAGLALAFRFSAELGLCPAAHAERVEAHLRAVGLPATLREANIAASAANLTGHMAQDKKRDGRSLALVLVRGVGQAFLDRTIAPEDIETFLDRELARA
jgi:3-dehydroquinate synthase